MNITGIKNLKEDIEVIRNIEATVSELKKNSHCDKLAFGFNKDSRFKSTGDIHLYLGGYKGFYGNSDVFSILSINEKDTFNKALIETLNDLRPMILERVADRLQQRLVESVNEISKEIKKLQDMYDSIQNNG